MREKLLDFTNEMDKQMEARYKQAQEFVESLLAQEDVVQAVQENLNRFTQDAVDVVNQLLRQASEKNDYTRMGKLQKMVEVCANRPRRPKWHSSNNCSMRPMMPHSIKC
jgi:preprotein translocase subunit SecA